MITYYFKNCNKGYKQYHPGNSPIIPLAITVTSISKVTLPEIVTTPFLTTIPISGAFKNRYHLNWLITSF